MLVNNSACCEITDQKGSLIISFLCLSVILSIIMILFCCHIKTTPPELMPTENSVLVPCRLVAACKSNCLIITIVSNVIFNIRRTANNDVLVALSLPLPPTPDLMINVLRQSSCLPCEMSVFSFLHVVLAQGGKFISPQWKSLLGFIIFYEESWYAAKSWIHYWYCDVLFKRMK